MHKERAQGFAKLKSRISRVGKPKPFHSNGPHLIRTNLAHHDHDDYHWHQRAVITRAQRACKVLQQFLLPASYFPHHPEYLDDDDDDDDGDDDDDDDDHDGHGQHPDYYKSKVMTCQCNSQLVSSLSSSTINFSMHPQPKSIEAKDCRANSISQ